MKKLSSLCLLLFTALVSVWPALGESRWEELRCSAKTLTSTLDVPAGKVVWIADYFGPPFENNVPGKYALRVRYERPEGATLTWASINSYIMGPCTLSMTWLGQVDAEIGVYWATFKVMDAVESGPTVNLSLEASTSLPAFKPASAYFRAVGQ